MREIFNRNILNRQGIEGNYTNKDGVEVKTTSNTARVLITGKVKDVRQGNPTKSGMPSATLTLEDTVYNDPDLGEMTEPGAIINFYDTQKGSAASQLLKMNIKQGAVVVVKADKIEQTNSVPSAEAESITRYMGQRVYYPGNAIQIKTNDDGSGTRVVFGYATAKDGKVSVPIRCSKKEQDGSYTNYTVFAACEIEGGIDETSLAKVVDAEGKAHARVVAIPCKPNDYKEVTANGVITSITAKGSECAIIA